MIYVASPYSHENSLVRTARFEAVRSYCAARMSLGEIVFSPIVYGHQFAAIYDHPTDAKFWEDFNHSILIACTECRVLKLDGWDKSVGVEIEIAYAGSHGIRVTYAEWRQA